MSEEVLFPSRPASRPSIYAYSDSNPQYDGLLKIGYTTGDVEARVKQQYPTLRPGKPPYRIVLAEPAMRPDGTSFSDHDVHRVLRLVGHDNPEGEWFKCQKADVRAAILAVRDRTEHDRPRDWDFAMRPEQQAAVQRTAGYFEQARDDSPDKTPRFLWNAKMRFGKTFAAYQLAKKMGWKRILVLTFKPAVQHAWEEDLLRHVDFDGWQFVSRDGLEYEQTKKNKPIVCFGSFQDYLGKNTSTGGIKTKNEWVHATHWDCVILDEYHWGAWRENAKELFEAEDSEERRFGDGEGAQEFDEAIMPITTGAYLYLSGTPFRALRSGEFIEEQIYNWTYSDEQRAKQEWKKPSANPYAALPRMMLLTYQLPDGIVSVASKGEFDEFDLNEFFKAEQNGALARFKYEREVQKWLDMIRGALATDVISDLKLGVEKPPMPFSDVRLLGVLSHTLWLMPSVAACHAMANLLSQKQNAFYRDYTVIVAAGAAAGIGADALPPVEKAMGDPLKTRTITLSCGKLTTGVTVRPWTGIFMLRNLTSPESYFQAAFRVQSPWTVFNPDGTSPNQQEIIKKQCYVLDFAPNRALKQIADYSCQLSVDDTGPEQKVAEFIKFLPILAYDGASMKQVDAAGVLDMAMSGTNATLLAKRWESTMLVNVDNATLKRLMDNENAMKALMSIEGFRNLNQDIETIINKSEAVNKARKEANDETISQKEKKRLTEEEKEFKSLRKQIQDKLIKFATRIPVFMYLTDYREQKLKDVITQLEPGLFKKVTGLEVKDFDLLVSLNVFDSGRMNESVYYFKRYEDASLSYAGIDRHEGQDIGLYDTTIPARQALGR